MPCAPTSTITERPVSHAIELDRRLRLHCGKAQTLSMNGRAEFATYYSLS